MRRAWVMTVTMLALAVPATASAEVTRTPLRFDVLVGPDKDKPCTVDADLYAPAGASAADPMPAVMGTNGFGGSKNNFDVIGPAFAERGYAFLAYSGLGFGDSTCKITLDDREHDGAAGSELVSFLGGLDYIVKDGPGDPRVGMLGGSYGGQVQFAVAAVDRRLDTIVPQITWNDLSYSLSPNNTGLTGVTYAEPGVVKVDWPLLFFGVGTGQGLAAALADPSRIGTCPNFADAVCPSLIGGAASGYLPPEGLALLRNASVSSYYDAIDIPVFLIQGQSDNLFNLQESVATYRALRERGTPVKLLWRSAGHSGGGLGDAESNWAAPETAYESRMVLQWFDYHLRGEGARPARDFSFLTDWLPYDGDAAPAVGVARRYPAGTDTPLLLSGTDALTADAGAVAAGSATMAALPGLPSSTGGGFADMDGSDPPGTAVAYTTAPLEQALDVVGVPKLTVRVTAPTFAAAPDPAARLVLFAKLYDVAPDGSARIPRNQVSAVRIADPSQPVTLELPGLAHRFARGHRLRLTVSTSSATYRSSAGGGPVTVETGPADPGVLTLPQVGAPTGAAGSGPNGTTPFGARVRAAARLRRARCNRSGRRVLRFRLKAAKRLRVARVRVDGKRVRTLRGRRLTRRVTVRLPRRRAQVVVTSRTKAGTRRRSARVYRRCR